MCQFCETTASSTVSTYTQRTFQDHHAAIKKILYEVVQPQIREKYLIEEIWRYTTMDVCQHVGYLGGMLISTSFMRDDNLYLVSNYDLFVVTPSFDIIYVSPYHEQREEAQVRLVWNNAQFTETRQQHRQQLALQLPQQQPTVAEFHITSSTTASFTLPNREPIFFSTSEPRQNIVKAELLNHELVMICLTTSDLHHYNCFDLAILFLNEVGVSQADYIHAIRCYIYNKQQQQLVVINAENQLQVYDFKPNPKLYSKDKPPTTNATIATTEQAESASEADQRIREQLNLRCDVDIIEQHTLQSLIDLEKTFEQQSDSSDEISVFDPDDEEQNFVLYTETLPMPKYCWNLLMTSSLKDVFDRTRNYNPAARSYNRSNYQYYNLHCMNNKQVIITSPKDLFLVTL